MQRRTDADRTAELHWRQRAGAGLAVTLGDGGVNGDGAADHRVVLPGATALHRRNRHFGREGLTRLDQRVMRSTAQTCV